MNLPLRSLLAACALVSTAAQAQAWNRPLSTAADAVEDAFDRAQRSNGRCRTQVGPALNGLVDRIDGLRRNATDVNALNQLRFELATIGQQAPFAACPIGVTEGIQRGLEALEDVRTSMWTDPERRGGSRRDRRNGQNAQQPFVQLSALQVNTGANHRGEPAVQITLPEVRFEAMQGQGFYVATRFRSYEGDWSDWATTQVWTIPSAPFVWRNAYNHLLRYSTLAEDDFSNGRFIAHVSIFNGQGQELAFREVSFRVTLPRQVPVPAPAPLVVQRDCGTGTNDPGCLMSRDGRYPMDAVAYQGILASLRAERFEMRREQTITSLLQSSSLTAAQFDALLDLFGNEISKMNVARAAAPRLVNAQHALGFGTKFRMSLSRRDYTQVIAAQPMGTPWQAGMPIPPGAVTNQQPGYVVQPTVVIQPPGVPQPAVIVQAPGIPLPAVVQPAVVQPVIARDCGTGAGDMGCSMTRNGLIAMDGATYSGFLVSLRGVSNELVREDMFERMVASNALTAQQLGQVLDLFNNELTRLAVAKTAAPRVVNPQHALGLSTKFNNSFNAQEFVEAYAGQR